MYETGKTATASVIINCLVMHTSWKVLICIIYNSEYDQEIPQSHNPNQPTAPWGRFKEKLQLQDIRNTVKAKQPALSSSSRWLQN